MEGGRPKNVPGVGIELNNLTSSMERMNCGFI